MKNLFKDELLKNVVTGEYMTREYAYHISVDDASHFVHVRSPFECGAIEIHCTYEQLFYDDSSLILCNNIVDLHNFWDDAEIKQGDVYDEDDEPVEVFQWYIIDEATADRLIDTTNEMIVYYAPLDLHILGVTHLGTGWDYVAATYYI